MSYTYSVPLIEGFLLRMGLVVGIGPQNAPVLRHGLRIQHPLLMALRYLATSSRVNARPEARGRPN
ncbi:MAG: hypothetical protein SFU83_00605 [Meiothermus sp.]|nr:hypothetical protein [Meiothermus sp.]